MSITAFEPSRQIRWIIVVPISEFNWVTEYVSGAGAYCAAKCGVASPPMVAAANPKTANRFSSMESPPG